MKFLMSSQPSASVHGADSPALSVSVATEMISTLSGSAVRGLRTKKKDVSE